MLLGWNRRPEAVTHILPIEVPLLPHFWALGHWPGLVWSLRAGLRRDDLLMGWRQPGE